MQSNKLRSLYTLCSIVFIVSSNVNGQDSLADNANARIDHNFELVRNQFSGEDAFNTVAFVEKFWRIAGNSGFDSSIYYVVDKLKKAGYVLESEAENSNRLTYRIEKRPMDRLTWEPVDAFVRTGRFDTLLNFDSNRNMVAVNSWSTPDNGFKGEVVYLNPEISEEDFEALDLKGKIVFSEGGLRALYNKAVKEKGAAGLMVYSIPDYLQPSRNQNSIQFRSIPQDTVTKSWAIVLSYKAKELLKQKMDKGTVTLIVNIKTELYASEELTLVADLKGSSFADERIVYSAHVQEPGANDNASGVGAQAEMASVIAQLVNSGQFDPKRSITFLFGDEIISTRRYISENESRAKGIKWGISLDMVGENTDVTGGSFLIEKMPDPSAIWTRGEDKHSEWGGSPISKEQLVPGYFNDFILDIFDRQGQFANWEVNSNPFEGGSDHVPFLRADIPSLLLWHFTDMFYHTDGDRLDKVSARTLENVGTGAIVAGMTLVNSDEDMALFMTELVTKDATGRLKAEYELSLKSIEGGGSKADEIDIMNTWSSFYQRSLGSIGGLLHSSEKSELVRDKIRTAQKTVNQRADKLVKRLERLE